MVNCTTARHAEAHHYLLGRAHHGVDVAEVHYRGLIAEVLKRNITQVEVNAFQQQVSRDQHFLVSIRQHRRIVANTFPARLVAQWKILCQKVDESKLTDLRYLSFFTHYAMCKKLTVTYLYDMDLYSILKTLQHLLYDVRHHGLSLYGRLLHLLVGRHLADILAAQVGDYRHAEHLHAGMVGHDDFGNS